MVKEARRIAVIDAETDPFCKGRIPEPFIWGFYDGDASVKYFNDVKQLIDFLAPQRLLVYAHNGGKFDYHLGFLRFLEPYSEVTIVNGRLAKFVIGECEFRDSVNILPIALKDFDKGEIDYRKLERSCRARHMPEIKRYLARDCTSLHNLVTEFVNRYGRGLTLAGSAMKTYRKMCKIDSVANHDADFFNTMKPYYFGGRVQCFHKGVINEPFSVFDINSAYPFAMLHDHPFSRGYDTIDAPPVDSPIVPQSLYHVVCDSDGSLPFRDPHGSLSFPQGESLEVHCTGWELQTALETNTARIHKIISRIDFGVLDNFSVYINHFYAMKQKAIKGSPDYIFAKLFMNSLYGKYGANPGNYANFGICPTEFEEIIESRSNETFGKHTGNWKSAGYLGQWSLMKSELNEDEKFYFNLATAASITGFVRAMLWRHACGVRQSGGRLLYCDTDSLAFAGKPAGFQISKELGAWSDDGEEGSGFASGAIAGKKLYAFRYTKPFFRGGKKVEWKCASKGVRLDASDIVRIAKGEVVEWENEAPTFSVNQSPRMLKRKVRMT